MKNQNVIVIGAGLAGAAVAHRLAELEFEVSVIDSAGSVAQGASGNLAGALHPLVTADWNLRSQWYWEGFQATLSRLKPWLASNEIEGELKGLMHLAVDHKSYQRMHQALKRVAHLATFTHWCEAERAAQIMGGRCLHPGLFFPQAGWFNPPSIVNRCLNHSNISIELGFNVSSVIPTSDDLFNQKDTKAWLVKTDKKDFEADRVVLATGGLSGLNETFGLSIRPVKGQVSALSPSNQAWSLNCAVAHQGYSTPACKGYAVTGATFEAPDMKPEPSEKANMQNLAMVQASLPDWLTDVPLKNPGRVSFRPTTPDHLPIIGAVADSEWMQTAYLSQSPSHAPYRFPPQRYRAGLYVSNGHGARGLMSVFLAAEIIAAQIMGNNLPIDAKLLAANHPARFAIRNWQRKPQ